MEATSHEPADPQTPAPATPDGPDVSVRQATSADIDELIRLDAVTRAAMAGIRGGEMYFLRNARVEPVASSFLDDIADPDRLVLLGSIGEAVVGFAVVSAVELAGGYQLADINEIFVEEGVRDVGVGEALMSAITSWASDRGCHGLDSRALPGDRSTKNFFESNGLVARAILVHRDLREP